MRHMPVGNQTTLLVLKGGLLEIKPDRKRTSRADLELRLPPNSTPTSSLDPRPRGVTGRVGWGYAPYWAALRIGLRCVLACVRAKASFI